MLVELIRLRNFILEKIADGITLAAGSSGWSELIFWGLTRRNDKVARSGFITEIIGYRSWFT